MPRGARHIARIASPLLLLALLAGAGDGALARRRGRRAPRSARVVQVTATTAYINVGRRAGLDVGDRVTLTLVDKSRADAIVLDVWTSGARVELPAGRALPRRGARVSTPALRPPPPRVAAKPKPQPRPEPLDVMLARWQSVSRERPALIPARRSVPRAAVAMRSLHARGTLRLEYLGLYDLGDSPREHYHQVGLWSELELPRLIGRWLGYSHRLRLTLDLARDLDERPFRDHRPHVRVYQMRAAIRSSIVRGELGRMVGSPLPSAALIDGASVRFRVARSLYVGAFGGMEANPTDLEPSLDASRFGAYTSLRLASRRSDRWSLAADLGVIGTTWGGVLDRKAIATRLALHGKRVALYAQAVIDGYGSDHPAGRPSIDPSLLLAEIDYTPARWLSVDLRFDRYRFVASRQALALFPPDFSSADAALGLRSAATLRPSGRVDLRAEVGWERQGEDADALWVEGTVDLLAPLGDADRVSLSWLSSSGSALDENGARLAYAMPLAEWLSTSLSYGLTRYGFTTEIDGEGGWRHELSWSAEATAGRHWSLALDARAQLADSERVLLTVGTLAAHF